MHLISSKLPKLGDSIFSVMSQLASEQNALNLSQGFPEFNPPEQLIEFVNSAMNNGFNQYAPMPGHLKLRETISTKENIIHGNDLSPLTDITITPGATAALFATIQALITVGDEVIIIDPAYDSYDPAVRLAGGNPIHISYDIQNLEFPWEQLESKLSSRSKMIILTTPHNPLGLCFSEKDFERLSQITEKYQTLILSDEVYEFMVYDGNKHVSVLSIESLKSRAVKISSFGKTLHCTGWKLGYIAANKLLSSEIRKIYQFLAFSANSAIQIGVADFLSINSNWETELSRFYQLKRDYFISNIENEKLSCPPSNGSYFQMIKIDHKRVISDFEFAKELTIQHKLACIPLDVFIEGQPQTNWFRFCFAKNEETLNSAANILSNL